MRRVAPTLPGFLLAASLSLIASSATSQSRILTVDDDAPADFASITGAIAAAAAGDVVLVRSGDYEPFVIDGIGISLVADEGASVHVHATTGPLVSVIRNVPAGQRVVVRGVRFSVGTRLMLLGPLLHVDNCAGVVWVEDTVVDSVPGVPTFYTLGQRESARVENSPQVVLVASTFRGSTGSATAGNEIGSRGLRAFGSSVFMHGCTVYPGGTVVAGGTGMEAIAVVGGLMVLRDCVVVGGPGGAAGITGVPNGGTGGPGVELSQGATLYAIGSSTRGGSGGPGSIFGGGPGSAGQPFEILSGSVTEAPAQTAELQSTRLVAVDPSQGGSATFDLTTTPGANTVLLVSLTSEPAFAPGLPGFLGVPLTSIALPTGVTDAAGQLALVVGVPTIPGVPTWSLTAQFATAAPSLGLTLSNPSVTTITDV